MFTIGEFSRITGLTIKTLRFYHEEGLLVPAYINEQTGYRYYHNEQIERARVIAFFRTLEFPLSEIKAVLEIEGEEDLLAVLEKHKSVLQARIRNYSKCLRSLDQFISEEREAGTMTAEHGEICEKDLPPLLIAGIRMKGHYSNCGKGFAKIGRAMGRFIAGKPLLLHYDTEFKEEEADFEACIPIKQMKQVPDISTRQLPSGRCVSLMHKGPYEQLGHSYAAILQYINDKGYKIIGPTREIYLKGPGMIFKGDPKNYLTEIQMLIEPKA